MKIIIAPDSFKGSLTAQEAAFAMEQGVRAALPSAEIDAIAMADGGEGTLEALVASTKGYYKEVEALDPLNRPMIGRYGILGHSNIAIIEMATVSGILLLKNEERNPLHTTTFGTGQLIRHALEAGCNELVVGIGGSATNDCGAGMAQALGVRFLRDDKSEITEKMCGGFLEDVASIDMRELHPAIQKCRIVVACDVKNPLLGHQGCSLVYSKQKGASPEIEDRLEKNMTSFIDIAEHTVGREVRNIPGAGAAGGIGAGLMLFLDAELKSGIEIVMDTCNFTERIKNADLILTGEGTIDHQTVFGKTIAGIAMRAKPAKIPVIAFGGNVEDVGELNNLGITNIYSIRDESISIEESITQASTLLREAVAKALKIFSGSRKL